SQLFASTDGNHREFRRKSFHVVFFLVDKAARNQQWKRHVLVASSLESPVQRLLHILPERPTIRTHNHATTHRRIVSQLRLQNQLVVPLGEILRAGGKLFFSHAAV